jgi:hypothetical protein
MTTGISPWPPIQWLAKCNLIASKPCLECSWSYLDNAYNQINDNSPVWDYAAWLGRFSIVVLQRIPVIGKIMELAKRLFRMSNDLYPPPPQPGAATDPPPQPGAATDPPPQPGAATDPPLAHPSNVTKEEIVQIKESKDFSSLVNKYVYIERFDLTRVICQINRIVSQNRINISVCNEQVPTQEPYYKPVGDIILRYYIDPYKYDLEDDPREFYDTDGKALSLAVFVLALR